MRSLVPILLIGGLIGAVVFWKDICKPIGDIVQTDLCSGGNPIDKIAQATQDAIKQFAGTGNPGQGALNSGTQTAAIKKDLESLPGVHAVTPLTPAQAKQQIDDDVSGKSFNLGSFSIDNTGSKTIDTTKPLTTAQLKALGTAKFARSNLGEISLYRMSIG